VNADREACLELEEEGWMQTGKFTVNRRKKDECRQGSILGIGRRRRVDADREAYLEQKREGWMQRGKHI